MENRKGQNEEELLHDVQSGDRAAMHRLYERYAGYAMAIGFRYIPDEDAVRDVVQDSFVKILTSVGKFHFLGEGSLKAWISRIVANTAIDYLHRKELLTAVPIEKFANKVDDDTEPTELDKISPEILTEMIGKLPTAYRVVLNLHAIEGFSHQEIARQMGINVTNSASRFFRAKKMLAHLIEDYLKTKNDER